MRISFMEKKNNWKQKKGVQFVLTSFSMPYFILFIRKIIRKWALRWSYDPNRILIQLKIKNYVSIQGNYNCWMKCNHADKFVFGKEVELSLI